MILKHIKKYAESYENNKIIKNEVITVHVHFNRLQRDTTIKAAKDAGFKNIKLLNEPTALQLFIEI